MGNSTDTRHLNASHAREAGLLSTKDAILTARSLHPAPASPGNTRLRPSQHEDILIRLGAGESPAAIALLHGVSASRVRQIARSLAETEATVATVDDLRLELVDDVAAGNIDVARANDLLVVVAANASDFRYLLSQRGGSAA